MSPNRPAIHALFLTTSFVLLACAARREEAAPPGTSPLAQEAKAAVPEQARRFWPEQQRQRAFESDTWKSDPRERFWMMSDLLARHPLLGMSARDVADLLGPLEATWPGQPTRYVYWFAPQEGFWEGPRHRPPAPEGIPIIGDGGQYQALVLELDATDRVGARYILR